MRKIALENLKRNRPSESIFIGFPKYSRWDPDQAQNGLSVDRRVDRPTVRFLTIGDVSRPTCRLTKGRLPIGRPPGRLRPEPESLLSGRSIGRSTGADPESKLSGSVDRPVDRPSSQGLCTLLCTPVDRSIGRLPEALNRVLKELKLDL